MVTAEDVRAVLDRATADAVAAEPLRRLGAGALPPDQVRELVGNVVRTHFLSPHVLAFVFGLAPGAAAPALLANLREELGETERGRAHPELLRDLMAGAGFSAAEADAAIAGAAERVRALCARPLPFPTMREVGLGVLLEMLAFEHFLAHHAGRLAEVLAVHYGLPRASLQWFDLHAEVDIRHAEEGLDVACAYLAEHGLDEPAFARVCQLTFAQNPVIRAYFPDETPRLAPAPSRPSPTPMRAPRLAPPAAIAVLDVYRLHIPFVRAVAHARYTRAASDAVVVRLRDADGRVGYGEGLPREYVTGEDLAGMVGFIRDHLAPRLFATAWTPDGDLFAFLREHAAAWTRGPAATAGPLAWSAAYCAVELALLDLALRRAERSLADYLPPVRNVVQYDGVIPSDEPADAAAIARRFVAFGIDRLKVKVGTPDDEARLAAVRDAVGDGVRLRVDANGVWTADEALARLERLRRFGLDAVEQPVAAADLAGLRCVRQESGLAVVADESLVRLADAEALVAQEACDVFNVRVSKCGGISGALRIAAVALANGLPVQVGAQVGETALLSAAGRHLAAHLPNVCAVEGSFGRLLLADDVAPDEVAFGYGGKAPLLDGAGLGVAVDDAALERLAVDRLHLERGR